MKNYHIKRQGESGHLGEVTVRVEVPRGPHKTFVYMLTPEASLKQRNHSPTGFEFGYGGSGPAQLALAILMDFTGKVPHPAMYQEFKSRFIASMGHPGGIINGEAIQQFIDTFDGREKFMPPGEKP